MQVIFCIGPVQDMIDVNEKALWPPARPAMQRCIKTRTVNVFKDPSTLLFQLSCMFGFCVYMAFVTLHRFIRFIVPGALSDPRMFRLSWDT